MKVAVTGASGYVGGFVVGELLKAAAAVTVLDRRGTLHPDRDVRVVAGELTDSGTVNRLVAGQDALVHCAFEHEPGRYRGGEGDDPVGFWRTNLMGTVGLLDAARRAGVNRAVTFSSRAVFGDGARDPHGAEGVGDDHPARPDTHYGALKLATEALSAAVSATSPLAVTALRTTGVYGLVTPLRRTKWYELAQAVAGNETVEACRTGSEVHGRDVAAAVRLLLEADVERVGGRTFNCSDLILSTRDVLAGFARLTRYDQPLPPPCPPPPNVMRCDGLRELGWHPGGRALFDDTLDQIWSALHAQRGAV